MVARFYQEEEALVVKNSLPNIKEGTSSEKISRLKKRADFLRIEAASAAYDIRWITPALIVIAAPSKLNNQIRVGFTVSKKVGIAVERNLIKRRLREIIRFPQIENLLLLSHDYVIIARSGITEITFQELMAQTEKALSLIAKKINEAGKCLKPL